MPVKRGHLYIIDFNPRIKTKPGKLRPGLVLQSDLVNEAVKQSLTEDADDLAAFEDRAREKTVSFEKVLREMRRRGKL